MKLKSGTPFKLNNTPVWVEHDRQDGTVSVCFNEGRLLTDHYKVVKVSDLSPIVKPRTQVNKVSAKKKEMDEKQLNDFYDKMALEMHYYCENCGEPLWANTKYFKRCCTAHILPKAEFESVATNPDNILFMGCCLIGICTCHETWDSNKDRRIKMKVYPKALEQFKKLIPFLDGHDLNKATKYLGL